MGSITLNKPSGGQLTIAPEDGTSNETVTIPSVGVGKVLQVVNWSVGPTAVSTAGSWAVSNTPTRALTYQVAQYTFTKKQANSKVIAVANGHVDIIASGGAGASVVTLFEEDSSIIGSAYMHCQYVYDEPYAFTFSGEVTNTALTQTYYLCCHSNNGTSMYFGRTASSLTQNTYNITLMEVAA